MKERSRSRILLDGEGGRGSHAALRPAKILVLLGSAFLAVGLADLALLWSPLRFGSLAWEFSTVGRTLDGLPMTVLGLGLIAYGALRAEGADRRVRALALAFAVAALLVLAMGFLLATALPTVLQQTTPDTVEGVRRAAVRHAVQVVAYTAALGLVAGALWRTGRGTS